MKSLTDLTNCWQENTAYALTHDSKNGLADNLFLPPVYSPCNGPCFVVSCAALLSVICIVCCCANLNVNAGLMLLAFHPGPLVVIPNEQGLPEWDGNSM